MISGAEISGSSSRGFTLLELLLSAALTATLVVFLLLIATRAVELWERSAGRIEAARMGQRVLNQLESDLECAGPLGSNGAWLTAQIGQPLGVPSIRLGGSSVGADRYGPGAMTLRMVTSSQALGSAAEPPLPVVVTYRLARLPDGSGGGEVFVLCRIETKPEDSFRAGFDLGATPQGEAETGELGLSSGGLAALLPAALGVGIIDFGVRVVAGDETLFPVSSDAREFALRGRRGGQWTLEVEVVVRVLTARGALAVAAIGSGQITGDWWQAVEQGSVLVTRRVRILGTGR